MNHPYVCGQHLNNVVVYTPFFHEGELVAFLAVRAHWIDIGGTRVGFGFSGTREVYEEGLQFRSLKLYRGDEPNQDIFQIITDNVRFADSCLGDLRAQIAACRVGDRGLGASGRNVTDWKLSCVVCDRSGISPRHWRGNKSRGSSRASTKPKRCSTVTASISTSRAAEGEGRSRRRRDDRSIFPRSAIRCRARSIPANPAPWQQRGLRSNRWCSPFSPIDEGCFRPLKVVIPEGKILSATAPGAGGQLEPHACRQ